MELVARRYALNDNLIFKWLKDPRYAPGDTPCQRPTFLPVEINASSTTFAAPLTVFTPKKSLIEDFSALEDPRWAWKLEYPLPDIMLLVLCATLAGTETFVETALWGRKKLEFLHRLLPFIIAHKATGAVTTAQRYNISSLALDQAFFAKAARAHWGVENRLYWVLDFVYDLMRLRTANGPKICLPSYTWPSTSSNWHSAKTASASNAKPPVGATQSSSPSSEIKISDLQAIALGCGRKKRSTMRPSPCYRNGYDKQRPQTVWMGSGTGADSFQFRRLTDSVFEPQRSATRE